MLKIETNNGKGWLTDGFMTFVVWIGPFDNKLLIAHNKKGGTQIQSYNYWKVQGITALI